VFRRLPLLAAVPLLLLGLSACGAGSLAAEDVATGAEDALEEQVGARPDISCPDDIDAKVGAETRCTLTAGGDPTEYGVTVTVTSDEGDSATFDVEVDEEPQG
jgi:hypothetical protein